MLEKKLWHAGQTLKESEASSGSAWVRRGIYREGGGVGRQSKMAAIASVGPGAVIELRSALWRVSGVNHEGSDKVLHCVGLSGPSRDKKATFVQHLEQDIVVCNPAQVTPVPDRSAGFLDTKIALDASLRMQRPEGSKPTVVGRAAIDDLSFQHTPVSKILLNDRPRLLIADDVGLGKTLEAGLVAAELIARGRAERILVVTTRAMMGQFQREFWTRFSIPLARLDSAAIRRMRNELPAHLNVFDQFSRAIVSIDTLKRDLQYRTALEASRWDLVIIDEAHNAADRKAAAGQTALRAKLAQLLSRQTDALLLLTATPHDGSAQSFASLITMLDPTRVADPEKLRREDIEDLVVRRFRSTPEVKQAMKHHLKERRLKEIRFPLTAEEEVAYRSIADLKLDMDEMAGKRRPGHDLFRTGVAKAIFSSPAACAETLRNRLARIASKQARGTPQDVDRLRGLLQDVEAIDKFHFTKYAQLLGLLHHAGWTGRDRHDRLVIFSERIATLNWLAEHLGADLGLPAEAIARIDGSSFEDDEVAQKALEDFGQAQAPLRILLASDMASEGLNLHHQCYRLIHFDLPWSLLRFQQRNGRIDRYGQEENPEIYYFIAESTHPQVRDMWVVEKLVERDKAAQGGIGDPAVFLRASSIEEEEAIVGDAVAAGIGAKAFDDLMEANATAPASLSWHLLFGPYGSGEETFVPVAPPPPAAVFRDTFSFVAATLQRLSPPTGTLLSHAPKIDHLNRTIQFRLPDALRSTDSFGYARSGDVDDRYMPVEALPPGDMVELTDKREVIDRAIAQARREDNPWPRVQYLWDLHPIARWLSDYAQTIFPGQNAPLCRLPGRLKPDEVVLIAQAAITTQLGRILADIRSAIVIRSDRLERIEAVAEFIQRTGFDGDVPNQTNADGSNLQNAISVAVDAMQWQVNKIRKDLEVEITQDALRRAEALSRWRARHDAELERLTPVSQDDGTLAAQRARRRREKRLADLNTMFEDAARAVSLSSQIPDEPNPFIRIMAIFQG